MLEGLINIFSAVATKGKGLISPILSLVGSRSTILIMATAAVSVTCVIGYFIHVGYKECEGKQAKVEIQGVKTNAKIEEQVGKVSHSKLDKRISPWVR